MSAKAWKAGVMGGKAKGRKARRLSADTWEGYVVFDGNFHGDRIYGTRAQAVLGCEPGTIYLVQIRRVLPARRTR